MKLNEIKINASQLYDRVHFNIIGNDFKVIAKLLRECLTRCVGLTSEAQV
jgi:hypothetical protein